MVRCNKFSLVGNEFWRALHFKFLILSGICKDQIPRPSDLSLSNCSSLISASSLAFKNQYSNLLVHDPLWVKGQNKLSSASCYNNGIVLAKSVSSGIKMLSINSWFHCLVVSSMRISTLAPAIKSIIGDRTCGEFFLGSQKFCQMLTDFPFPILHRHPLSKTSLPCNMLVQAWNLYVNF